jgi:hypothetical protein
MARSKYPLSLAEHRRVGLTLSAMRSMLGRIATGTLDGGSFRWGKTTTVSKQLVKLDKELWQLMMALENEAAAQLTIQGKDSSSAIDLSCPPKEDVTHVLKEWELVIGAALNLQEQRREKYKSEARGSAFAQRAEKTAGQPGPLKPLGQLPLPPPPPVKG